MSQARSDDDAAPARGDAVSLSVSLGRYFFYGWLFRDASAGSALERAAAMRHNRTLARWLPTYLRRWFVVAALLSSLAALSERALDNAVLSAGFAVAFVLVVVFLLVTLLAWALLRAGHDAR